MFQTPAFQKVNLVHNVLGQAGKLSKVEDAAISRKSEDPHEVTRKVSVYGGTPGNSDQYFREFVVNHKDGIPVDSTRTVMVRDSYNEISLKVLTARQNSLGVCMHDPTPPKVHKESPKFRHLLATAQMSARARSILTRSNYKRPYSLDYSCDTVNLWSKKYLRSRCLSTAMALLMRYMLEKDYPGAWKVLCSLMHVVNVELRDLFPICIELFIWRYRTGQSQTPEDDLFLNYMVVHFAHVEFFHFRRPNQFKNLELSLLFELNLARYCNEEDSRALDDLEAAINDRGNSREPGNWALLGLIYMRRGDLKRAVSSFEHCIEAGGGVPPQISDALSLPIHRKVDRNYDDSTTESSGSDSDFE